MSNPFFYGNPVSPDQFFGRRREVRRIVNRLVNRGQSTAIVGEPRTGRTSLLLYLSAEETRKDLYGAEGERLLFSFLDAQTWGAEFDQVKFWEHALRPLYDQGMRSNPNSPLSQAYQMCQDNGFGAFVLERLLAQMRTEGWRLVLLLDEFNKLLRHPVLHSGEFFGSLRSLASRSRGALALVVASRYSLESLNRDTLEFSRTGSPYFNFLDEIIIGPLADKDVAELLRRGADHFTADDRRFIMLVGGGHPYLIQLAAAALWEAYEDHEEDMPSLRRQQAGQSLYDEAAMIMSDIWRAWPPATRKAFAAVALAQIPWLLNERRFQTGSMVHDMADLEPELRLLKKHGFVTESAAIPGGWRVRPAAVLWWLADEVRRTIRPDTPFEDWLREQELDGLVTRKEKQRFDKALGATMVLLKGGVSVLIEAAAKGLGEAMVK